jgi:catechol 2,3-dioxygenase-like lactoylglutathione lyase family enzyme
MFSLPKIFHVSHVVDDLDAAIEWYLDVFSPRVWQRTELFGTSLALLVVGDVVMMPMSPPPGASTAPGRFKERFGQRLHSLALYVNEPVALIDHLHGLGLRLTGSSGQPLRDPTDEIWTHPRETPMLLEFFEPRPSMSDPRLEEAGWSSAFWRDEHPLGIMGACCTVVTPDLDDATRFFVDGLRGTVVHRGDVIPYATRSSFVTLSDEVTMEVAEPASADGSAAQDLTTGATFHAVTFRVADLPRAATYLASKGIRMERSGAGHAVADPEHTLGVRMRFTDRDVTDW